MEEIDAPSLEGLRRGSNPLAALRLLSGGRRAPTLRAPVRAWERFAQWMVARWGRDKPHDGWDLIDYLNELAQKPVGRSALKSVWSMYRFMESVSGLGQECCSSESEMVRQMFEGVWSEELQGAGQHWSRAKHRGSSWRCCGMQSVW